MKNSNKEEIKRLVAVDVTLLGAVIFAASAAFFMKSLSSGGLYVPYCLCHDLLHLYCPFCGCTRAALALLKLDFVGSFLANPLVILFSLGCIAYNAISIICVVRSRKIPDLGRVGVFVGVCLLVFFALRNILMIFFGIDTLGELIVFWS